VRSSPRTSRRLSCRTDRFWGAGCQCERLDQPRPLRRHLGAAPAHLHIARHVECFVRRDTLRVDAHCRGLPKVIHPALSELGVPSRLLVDQERLVSAGRPFFPPQVPPKREAILVPWSRGLAEAFLELNCHRRPGRVKALGWNISRVPPSSFPRKRLSIFSVQPHFFRWSKGSLCPSPALPALEEIRIAGKLVLRKSTVAEAGIQGATTVCSRPGDLDARPTLSRGQAVRGHD